MKFTVQRSKWLRGRGASALLQEDGQMCCLGHRAKACGMDDSKLLNISTPAKLYVEANLTRSHSMAGWLLNDEDWNSHDCIEIMAINDSKYINEERREKKLMALFAKHGDEIVFVD